MTNNKTKQNKKTTFVEGRNKLYTARQKNKVVGPIQMFGTVAGGIAGSAFGPLGAGAASALGGAIGNGIGWLTGTGDYKVSSNACTVPSFRSNESTVITHREYIQDIVSGTGSPSVFNIQTLSLNPGVTATFPWLAQIAANYEEYDIQGMVFQFVSTSGDSVASANTALGTVIMATEYDPTKPAFINKQAMENYTFSNSFKPSGCAMHPIECKKMLSPVKQLYVRSGNTVGNDLRWSDFGNFSIATVGTQQANTTLGELWVTYKVKLLKPRLPVTLTLGGQIASSHLYRTGVSTSNPLGVVAVFSSGPLAANVVGGNTLTWIGIPNMTYLVTLVAVAASTVGGFYRTSSNNVASVGLFSGDTSDTLNAGSGTVSQSIQSTFVCTATVPNQLCSIGYISTVSGPATVDILVTELDYTVIR